MSTEGKLVEFHKAKTILMKPQADWLINFFFRVRWFFTSVRKEWEGGRGNENIFFSRFAIVHSRT